MTRWAAPGILAAALLVGLAAVDAAWEWDQPLLWVPDLLVGLAFAAAAASLWRRAPGSAVLLGLTAAAWYAASFFAIGGLFRGFLMHALIAYPGALPARRWHWAFIALGYVTAVVAPLWRGQPVWALCVVVVCAGVAFFAPSGAGGPRRGRRGAAVSVVAGQAVVTVAAISGWDPDSVVPTLIAFDVALVVVAAFLATGVRARPGHPVSDLILELGAPATTDASRDRLRDAIAAAVSDPDLRLGRWSARRAEFVTSDGEVLGTDTGDRAATTVYEEAEPIARIACRAGALDDAGVLESTVRAVRLAIRHERLEQEVAEAVTDVAASELRLSAAADEARRRLCDDLDVGVRTELDRAAGLLEAVDLQSAPAASARARERLDAAASELDRISHGLRPAVLQTGLADALRGLTDRFVIPVAVSVTNRALPAVVEDAVYYVCAEALSNIAKHARAQSASLSVTAGDGSVIVEICDDGTGGAVPGARGGGLTGMSRRIVSLGGEITVDTSTEGTRVRASIPCVLAVNSQIGR